MGMWRGVFEKDTEQIFLKNIILYFWAIFSLTGIRKVLQNTVHD